MCKAIIRRRKGAKTGDRERVGKRSNSFSKNILYVIQEDSRGGLNFRNVKMAMLDFAIRVKIRGVGVTIEKLFYSGFLSPKNLLILKMGMVNSLEFVNIFSIREVRVQY